MYYCPRRDNIFHLLFLKCQTLLNAPLVLFTLITASVPGKAIIPKCTNNCCWNRFETVINLVMYLIKDYYNILVMHAQYFPDSLSDPQWGGGVQAARAPSSELLPSTFHIPQAR